MEAVHHLVIALLGSRVFHLQAADLVPKIFSLILQIPNLILQISNLILQALFDLAQPIIFLSQPLVLLLQLPPAVFSFGFGSPRLGLSLNQCFFFLRQLVADLNQLLVIQFHARLVFIDDVLDLNFMLGPDLLDREVL